ncbi:MAG TPA: BsuPI-related putative proteinase inhibitor [Mycobacteriales bacterium]|nr:BsuPI-related putative proteinase inhibitor [Mycobacteriales bacterium]
MSTPRLPDPTGAVPPEPGTLKAVMAEARRRRVRRLGMFGGTGVAVGLAAVLAISLGGGDSSQTIGVTDSGGGTVAAAPPEPSPSCPAGTEAPDGLVNFPLRYCSDPADSSGVCTSDGETTTCTPDEQTAVVVDPTPTASPGSAPASPPGPKPTSYPSRSLSPGAPTPSPPTPRPAPSHSSKPDPTPPTPTPDPAPTGEPSQDARGEMTRTYVEGAVQCKDGVQWCADALPPPAGRTLTFTVRACRDADAGPGQLETGPPGADFEVRDGNGMVWRWSSGQAFPAVMMSLDVDAGDCLQWQTTWKGVDDANRALPAGRYDGIAYVTAEPVRDPIKYVVTLT